MNGRKSNGNPLRSIRRAINDKNHLMVFGKLFRGWWKRVSSLIQERCFNARLDDGSTGWIAADGLSWLTINRRSIIQFMIHRLSKLQMVHNSRFFTAENIIASSLPEILFLLVVETVKFMNRFQNPQNLSKTPTFFTPELDKFERYNQTELNKCHSVQF